jgi:hypothetical protein
MEYWNVGRLGLKSGKRSILKKNVASTFYDDARQASDFYFFSENTPQ